MSWSHHWCTGMVWNKHFVQLSSENIAKHETCIIIQSDLSIPTFFLTYSSRSEIIQIYITCHTRDCKLEKWLLFFSLYSPKLCSSSKHSYNKPIYDGSDFLLQNSRIQFVTIFMLKCEFTSKKILDCSIVSSLGEESWIYNTSW